MLSFNINFNETSSGTLACFITFSEQDS